MGRRDGAAFVAAVLLSLLLGGAAAVSTGTRADTPPVPGRAWSERHDSSVRGDTALEAAPDEAREKTLALLLLMLKEGRGSR